MTKSKEFTWYFANGEQTTVVVSLDDYGISVTDKESGEEVTEWEMEDFGIIETLEEYGSSYSFKE